MSNYFGKLNKSELASYARPLGINPAIRKQDLIDQIEEAAINRRGSLEKDTLALFQDYYDTLPDSPATAVVVRATTPRSTVKRRSRYSKAPEDDEDRDRDQSSEPPSADVVTPAAKKVVKAVRSTRKSAASALRSAPVPAAPELPASPTTPIVEPPSIEVEPMHPLSPGQLAASIPVKNFSLNAIGEAVSSWFAAAAQTTGLWEHVDYARETLSDPRAIHAIIASYEFAWLCHDLIPWENVAVPVPAAEIPYLGYSTGPATIRIPDLFILLSWNLFWAPIAYWFTLGVSFPLMSSYFVNIRKKSTYDPLTFSISKALIAYLVYNKQIIRADIPPFFTPGTSHVVNEIVGAETPLIGAGVGGLLTLWEAIISRR
ncbi:hypothetical protein TWF694_011818 [Orbilia ellipsospora]|uniref:SAP domain-containing protein n=1 Tax=Orbilia ellipsospora TaxID=2528407 RepID=A0AAV9X8Z9_9PEZI